MLDKKLTPHRVNDPGDLEVVNPTEMSGCPGFYIFPKNYSLAISKDGSVMNVRTRKVLQQFIGERNKVQVIIKLPLKKATTYYVHRLLAITFIGRPSRHLDKDHAWLEVNHIDGVRTNNGLDNLEWVTGKENAMHSHLSGFNPKDKPVLAKNIRTNAITTFHSSKACADTFGIHRATFWKHLESGNSGKFQKNMHVFKYDDENDWPEIDTSSIKTIGGDERRKAAIVEVLDSGQRFIFEDLAKATKYIKAPAVTVWRHVKRLGYFMNQQHKVSLI